MKTHRFNIARYFEPEADGTDNIYIDWPAVHRQAGLDHVQWLKNQDPTQCQLVVEQRADSPYTHVIAEIYSDRLATMYSLMWAK
jgi:hypothetical protein